MEKSGFQKFMVLMLVVSLISFSIFFLWDHLDFIRNTVHFFLDPTAGVLMNWNVTIGSIIVFSFIALMTTIVQKYATDQETLKAIRKEQKEIQKEIKKIQNDPAKVMELNSQSLKLMGKMLSLGMKSSLITMIPILLLFRWFMDFFAQIPDFRFFGFMTWFWFYLLAIIFISSIFRKALKVA